MNPIEIFELSNGLRVIYQPEPSRSSVLVCLTGKAGFRSEPQGQSGIGHFLEHLLFDGTAKRPSHKDFNDVVGFYGGRRNGGTSVDWVNYWVKIIPEHQEKAFDFLSDLATDALLTAESIEKERKVIHDEILKSQDNLDRLLYWSSLPQIFGPDFVGTTYMDSEPLGRFAQGDLERFYRAHYGSANFVLNVAGNITRKDCQRLAEQYFASLNRGEPVALGRARIKTKHHQGVIHKEVSQSGIQVNLPGVARDDPRQMIYRIYVTILGVGPTSRLADRLRHRDHLAYRASAIHKGFSDVGTIELSSAMQEDSLRAGYAAMLEEIALMTGIVQSEFDRAKNSVHSELVFDEDKVGRRQDRLSYELLYYDRVWSLEESVEALERVKLGEVQELARELAGAPRVTTIVTRSLDEADFA